MNFLDHIQSVALYPEVEFWGLDVVCSTSTKPHWDIKALTHLCPSSHNYENPFVFFEFFCVCAQHNWIWNVIKQRLFWSLKVLSSRFYSELNLKGKSSVIWFSLGISKPEKRWNLFRCMWYIKQKVPRAFLAIRFRNLGQTWIDWNVIAQPPEKCI